MLDHLCWKKKANCNTIVTVKKNLMIIHSKLPLLSSRLQRMSLLALFYKMPTVWQNVKRFVVLVVRPSNQGMPIPCPLLFVRTVNFSLPGMIYTHGSHLALRKEFWFYCRHAAKHNPCSMTTKGEDAFSLNRFDNYKKALEKFQTHEKSALHREAVNWWSGTHAKAHHPFKHYWVLELLARRSGLIKQLEAMKFLLQQGIPLRGHTDDEGNLNQLLVSWSNDNKIIQDWLKERQYQSHDIVNELIILMGQNVLRKLLEQMKLSSPIGIFLNSGWSQQCVRKRAVQPLPQIC